MNMFMELCKEKDVEEDSIKRDKKIAKLDGELFFMFKRAWKKEFSIDNFRRLQWLGNMYNMYKPQDEDMIRAMIYEIRIMIETQDENPSDYFCRMWKNEIDEVSRKFKEEI
jgi:hypothetical protein